MPSGKVETFFIRLLEDWRTGYIPERDDLAGETEGDNLRHLIVRGAFLDAFARDPRVAELIKHWQERTDVRPICRRIAVALGRVDEVVGLDLTQLEWDATTGFDLIVDHDSQPLLGEAEQAVRDFIDCINNFKEDGTSATVAKEAKAFVLKLGLPWPWLSIELVQLFWAQLFVEDFSWHYLDGLSSEPIVNDQPAPAVELSFRTDEGETVGQALVRLRKEVDRVENNLTRFYDPLPLGSIPKRTRDSLKRNAVWLYRHKVAKEPIKSISRRDFKDDEHRKHIRDGIKRAEELLSLTSYSF